MLTAPMTVYRIVLVHGVAAQLMMSVVYVVVITLVVRIVLVYQMEQPGIVTVAV